jgi:hypothetical protein
VPISQLKVGEKVLATSTVTGKTQAEAVTAVLVHHDTDLYDLKIRSGTGTSVIDTTLSHLFWVSGTGRTGGRWVKAGSLKYGTHLRAPSGSDTAVVTGGWVPAQRDGWMWDLTVPGGGDHDFYIDTTSADVLVHNCGINPNSVRFSQSSVSPNFSNGSSIEETVEGLRSGDISADDFPPIRLVEDEDGNLSTLDNRRLLAFQQAGLSEVPFTMATPEEAAAESWKFTTATNGLSIAIRGGGGIWEVPGG